MKSSQNSHQSKNEQITVIILPSIYNEELTIKENIAGKSDVGGDIGKEEIDMRWIDSEKESTAVSLQVLNRTY